MATRMRLLQPEDDSRKRIELFVLPPKLRKDPDLGRVCHVIFSTKLDADAANLCDERVQRAFEDCEFREREISHVELDSAADNTHIDFFELPESKERKLEVRNVQIVGLYVTRKKGTTYLYFQFVVKIPDQGAIARFFLDRFGFAIFAEFHASKFALTEQEQKAGAEQATLVEDPLYRDAVRLVIDLGAASTAAVQRKLRVGYGRASSMLDEMEREGIIGPTDGPKPRQILKRPGWIDEVKG